MQEKVRTRIDRAFISFAEQYAVRYWCNALGCTESALRSAVRAVGYNVDAVRLQLKKK